MKDIRNKYKQSGWSWSPKKHWKRRMERDIKKMTQE